MPHANGVDLSPIAYLSIGSNVGDREAAVLRAARLIESTGAGRGLRMSALYETAPVDCPPMADFVNAVVQVQPLHPPGDLLKRLQSLEKMIGRRGGHNEPRVVDIDIISVGQQLIRNQVLTVPHERYRDRRFVLVPLREIAPDYLCPESGKTIDEMIEALPSGQTVTRISTRKLVLR
jgi:2-amino-4-hydroxy-6-hydroxymethyldihydropteridine diphosphokinase